MSSEPLVSVVMPFYNTPPAFMQEAIESVLGQTYPNWELLLVDDGSAEESTGVALAYARQRAERIHYLEHDGHQNLGVTASRQLALEAATGDLMAFLDADDVWLPNKLAQQIAILAEHPEVGLLYGNTLYWYSWTGREEDTPLDYMPPLGVDPGTIAEPPALLALFLRGRAAVPCTCSLVVRRSALERVGGFRTGFDRAHQVYEDQVFYAKLCLETPVFVAGECWDKYRQHLSSGTAAASASGHDHTSRVAYLLWLSTYLVEQRIEDRTIWRAVQRECWRLSAGIGRNLSGAKPGQWQLWLKKWLLRLEERLAPESLQEKLWGPWPPSPAPDLG